MSETELNGKIEEASIPDELKIELKSLLQGMDALLPRLDPYRKRRSSYMIGQLVKEVIDPTVEPHWWEVVLDLLAKAAEDQGEAGRSVLEATSRLKPLLMKHMESYGEVSLKEITAETAMGICMLSDTLTEPKSNFVAPNVYSLAQAHFNKHAWFRAIYAGKAPVGFVMMVDNAEEAHYFLWRYMIAEPFHGRGFGRKAMERLVDYVRTRPGAKELLVSCGQGEGSPEGFYQKLGFVHTGEKLGDEVVMQMGL